MVEIRTVLLSMPEPMQLCRGPVFFADASFRPFRRGLVFLAALSLPVLGCATAAWFHGGVSSPVQVVAVPLTPPQSGAAASPFPFVQARADFAQAPFVQAKFTQSLTPR